MSMYHMHSPLPAGLRFEQIADSDVWHSDVRVFSVFDLSSGELLGYFYLDVYTRFTHYFEFTSSFVFAFIALVRKKWALIVEQGREIWSDLCGCSSKWFSSIQWCTTGD